MSLVDDIRKYYEDNSYPPEGDEFEPEAEQISWEVIDSAARWGNTIQVVYKRGDELVAVGDIEPATENQDWGDYGAPSIYPVEAVEMTVIRYKEIKNVTS